MMRRAINLDKDNSSRRQPSTQSQPSRSTSEVSGWGVRGTRELGSYGGISGVADAQIDLGNIAAQRASISINPVEQSAQVEIDLGIKRGLEVSGGIEVKRTPTGIEIGNVSFGVNVAGFGVNAEGRGSESSKIGIQAFGAKVEVASDKEGRTSVRLGFELPGIEMGITLQPDGEKVAPLPPTPIPAPTPPNFGDVTNPRGFSLGKQCEEDEMVVAAPSPDIDKIPKNGSIATLPWKLNKAEKALQHYLDLFRRENNRLSTSVGNNFFTSQGVVAYAETHQAEVEANGIYSDLRQADEIAIDWYINHWAETNQRLPSPPVTEEVTFEQNNFCGDWYWAESLKTGSPRFIFTAYDKYGKIISYKIRHKKTKYTFVFDDGGVRTMIGSPYAFSLEIIDVFPAPDCPTSTLPAPPTPIIIIPADLPNLPQKYKPMNCCDKVEEIYKYLGIAKLKKHKMKIAKQFLAPGGKGTEDCEDYYQITQALFRMLANGLILNPKCKPLGSEWQSTNATAWAGQMYEMLAESMSDGNSTQRFEVAAMMQLVQMMSAIAEVSRKVEFVADGLGFEPDLNKEELPVCFTIYEKHKGFGKFDPKKINTSNIKTDEEVEAVLGKMLNPSKVPIIKWQLKPGEITIKETLNA